ncbi:MAG: hypothetical protein A2V70_12340 [Planctomycetes bacterium RBG_13_63_9]|nr:MAG: hypothetical protein A2V70_12340 [Planctomycetes bacterium RBG_13_63_9]
MTICLHSKPSDDQGRPTGGCRTRRPVLLAVGLVGLLASGFVFGGLAWCAEAAEDTESSTSPSPSDLPPVVEQPAAEAASGAPAAEHKRCCCRSECRCQCRCASILGRLRILTRHGGRCRCVGSAVSQAKKPDPYAWRDLFDGKTLAGWKVPEVGGEGEVHVKDGAIVLEMGAQLTAVTYTGEVPRDDYEVSLEGARLDGFDFFCTTTFPVGKDPCTLVVGGWGGSVVGLSNVDYYDASDNMTSTFHEFKKDQWYKVRIRVTDARIEAWIDDEQVVNQEREGHKFGIRYEVDSCRPLGIGTWVTKGAVRNIRIRNLRPEEAKPQPSEKA